MEGKEAKLTDRIFMGQIDQIGVNELSILSANLVHNSIKLLQECVKMFFLANLK